MLNLPQSEKDGWLSTAEMLGDFRVTWGDSTSLLYRNDPKQFVYLLSRYKFAVKMACKKGSVLELGCGDGIGATILGESMNQYLGVDRNARAIQQAKNNLGNDKYRFLCDEFLGKRYGEFSAVVSFDGDPCIKTIHSNLCEEGVCVIGTPQSNGFCVINRLKEYFYRVFHFGMNGEIMTASGSTAEYTLAVGCHKKGESHV